VFSGGPSAGFFLGDAPPTFDEVAAHILARAPESNIEPGLAGIGALMELLGDPQTTFPSIHLAGTNGKTSTARMVDSLLSAFELRTGRYTSPHLQSMTERIVIDGQPVSEDVFVAAYLDVAPFLGLVDDRIGRSLTFFEVLTAMAFDAFSDAPVAVGVVEVGLGGRHDATNVVAAPVAAILPIGLDHQNWLGETLEEIAAEKAGIIHPDQLVVMAQQEVSAAEVVLREAAEVGATVAREGFEFGVLDRRVAVGGQLLNLRGLAGDYEDVFVPLHGEHQAHNAVVALAAVEAFLGGGREQLDPDVVRAGLARATSPGRLEVLRRSPTVLVDAAHNVEGARELARALEDAFDFERLVGVIGILADKDGAGILAALEPVLAEVVITRSTSPRAIEPADLAELAAEVFGPDRVHVADELTAAVDTAVALAEQFGLSGAGVVVTGSVTLAGDATALLGRP
jgi:dihydrofolate synthase / folylpolyglutamate synthase